MENSYVKIFRGLINWEWFTDSKMVHLYIYLLTRANYIDGNFKGKEVKRGQLITGRNVISEHTGISAQSIRTCLKRLESTNEITIKSTNDYSLITIVKYNDYQCFDKKSTSKSTSKSTNDQPTSNQQVTTSKEGKKGIKIIFQESKFFDKKTFAEYFKGWNKEKLLYYYDAAIRYSDEGNKYIEWGSAIKAWAKKDELQGKIKFTTTKNIVESGLL